MMKKIFKNALMTLALVTVFSGVADAKIKGLPAVKTYKDFFLKKNNVESVKYLIYAPKAENSTEKGEFADFGVEAFFDAKGNRIKEVIYHIETGAPETVTTWVYDEKKGTVSEVRTNAKGKLEYRIEYLVNYKLGTILMRRYENILSGGEVIGSMMTQEELWTDNTKKKTVGQKKTYYVMNNGTPLAAKQSIKEFDLLKPNTIFTTIDEFSGPIDCPWLTDYDARFLKTTASRTRKENVYNGDKMEYAAKNKLISYMRTLDKNKVLKNEVTYTYSFDKQKNWEQVLQHEDGKLRFIVERTINYNK